MFKRLKSGLKMRYHHGLANAYLVLAKRNCDDIKKWRRYVKKADTEIRIMINLAKERA